MTSIRKTKKALKREIRCIDAAIIELCLRDDCDSVIWNLFLCSNYLRLKIKSLGKTKLNPWQDKIIAQLSFSELEQRKMMNLIKGIK